MLGNATDKTCLTSSIEREIWGRLVFKGSNEYENT